MLDSATVTAEIPAQKLDRARAYYEEKLGLKPVEESPAGLRYQCGNGHFQLFESSGEPSGSHTQMSWTVDDLDAAVELLRRNGVVFEEYDMPGFKSENGIVQFAGARGAWFKDSEGNLLALGESSS